MVDFIETFNMSPSYSFCSDEHIHRDGNGSERKGLLGYVKLLPGQAVDH